MSIESMMPSNHLILCRPLLLLPSIFPSIRVFSSESALCIKWPKYWSFSLNISPSNEHPGLISLQSKGLSSQRLWHSQESRNRSFSWNVLAFSMIQWMLAIERGDQGADRLKLQSQTTSQLDHRTTSCLTQ